MIVTLQFFAETLKVTPKIFGKALEPPATNKPAKFQTSPLRLALAYEPPDANVIMPLLLGIANFVVELKFVLVAGGKAFELFCA